MIAVVFETTAAARRRRARTVSQTVPKKALTAQGASRIGVRYRRRTTGNGPTIDLDPLDREAGRKLPAIREVVRQDDDRPDQVLDGKHERSE